MKNTKNILIVEDDQTSQLIITSILSSDYQLSFAKNAGEALELVGNKKFDLIMLDVILPDLSGFEICRKLRMNDQLANVPIIFVTSKESISDQVTAFSLGGDDYITKPVNALEVKARVDAKFRNERKTSMTESISAGAISVFPLSRRVFVNNQEIETSGLEFDLLLYLIQHVDIVLNREQILSAVWKSSAMNVTDRTIDTHVSKLRKKLKPFDSYIQSIHGVGYKFVPKSILKTG